MTRLLALLDDSPTMFSVLRTASSLATVIDATVDAIHVRPPGDDSPDVHVGDDVRVLVGDPDQVLRRELEADDVIAAVLASRSTRAKPIGHLARSLVATSPVPLIVLPPDHRGLVTTHPQLLVPLDGVMATTTAISPIVRALTDAGAHVRVVHFYDSAALPPFVATSEELGVLAEEFGRRHLPEHAERCVVRVGDPAHHIIEEAIEQPADAIVVAWSQDLGPGRAEVIRRLLGESPVPLIVAPIK